MTRWATRALLLLGLWACGSRDEPAGPGLTVTGLEPTSGDPSGGKIVQIVGTGFDPHSAVEVWFGPKQARAIVIAKDKIQVESPPGVDGEESDVTVRFPDGRNLTVPQRYRWEPPRHP